LLAQWVAIGLLLFAIFNLFQASSSGESQSPLAFSDFLNDVDNGRVSDVKIKGNNISGYLEDGLGFATYAPNDPDIVNRLVAKNVRITAAPDD
jgi:cell division protease FtsH